MDLNKPVFGKKSVLEKQRIAKENYEKQITELRSALEEVASTVSGEKVLRYLFLLCGGDNSSIRREPNGNVSMEDTLITLGSKEVYDTIRFNLSSETVRKIESHT